MQSFADSGSSTHSRAPGKDELKLERSEQLDKVVPCPDIMYKLVRKLQESLKARHQPARNDPFMFLLTVDSRCAHLPGSICSEHDTEDWVHSAILRPAIAVVQYLLNSDTLMFKFSRDVDNAVLTIEFKTHRALGGDWLETITELLASANYSDLPGAAAKFHWPEYNDTNFDKATNVLLQDIPTLSWRTLTDAVSDCLQLCVTSDDGVGAWR
ncbi:hypothetical protein IMY05_C4754000100 [Salix suchowensis]|nr:hypothetical protein IMY05_C4754000100 [Salix suchowensis]